MHNFDVKLENPRSAKALRPGGRPRFDQGASEAAREEELQRVEGMKIAQSAVQGIGMSTKEIRGTWMNNPNYALAVSLLFTRATSQRIVPGTEPGHVLSTSLLYNSLLHDTRFMQVPMSRATPGDIMLQSGSLPDGYAGIVVDHGRIVSDSSNGAQNNSSLVELQRRLPPTLLFRYIGVQRFPGYTLTILANAGFNPDEPRLPTGQPGGGQWTTGGARGAQMAPSTVALSGRNTWIGSGAGTNTGQPDDNNKPKTAKQMSPQGETSDSLLAKVLQALKEGGTHPTPAQLEKVGEACDAWQHYAVDHGVPQDVAGALIQDFIHTYFTGKSDPNLENEYNFRQGEPAGSEAATIIAGAFVAISNIPGDQPFLKVEPPAGKFGSGDFGNEMHAKIAEGLKAKYPNVSFVPRVEPGQTGVDVIVPDKDVPDVGFKYAEIKPNSASGQKTFGTQVQRWKDSGQVPQNGIVQPITYDANGDVHLGFKLNQTTK